MVYRMTFCKEITLYLRKTIYIRMNYIGLPLKRDFIIIKTHLTISNTILNIKTPKITILTNPTKKTLKIGQKTHLNTIHKYADITFIFIDTIYIFVTLSITTTTTSNIKSFSPIQKNLILGSQYQYILLDCPVFDKNILTVRSPYNSGRRHEAVAGSQVGHSSTGNGSCGNRLIVYLIP